MSQGYSSAQVVPSGSRRIVKLLALDNGVSSGLVAKINGFAPMDCCSMTRISSDPEKESELLTWPESRVWAS